ncbi:TonB-dependent hemoglobin/transferrin/lactoferrin family receptor [Lysobacter auxotrophicus]|uniref:TonB-dependent hemoglobin/transferrin/lactoferrin family receptor n=1 Tax=Lysobacter auxotrophicus TaxID=2992573 RepID=A0ABN6UMX3_9GAMM|nr:TonB-dependent hemoglobin/transferrin/lactoferrin family receptor [Lysobacter auxotrophicus]BDU17778.1 TonB-dependent hemoglobin/transferrin/lactoferrin family receptor [Lysobacter auxotrophicus]
MHPVRNTLALALLLAIPTVALANDATPEGSDPALSTAAAGAVSASELDRIVVTATLTQRALDDVPNVVTAIDRDEMDRHLVRDLKDLFRYEPGITVSGGSGRFGGLGDIRIRGLGGNRVRIETDGIAVPDAFSIGSFSKANRNFVDLDTLKAVEVVRGPGSALYGSDALGGVVSFVTKDPSDYLADGKDAYFGLKFGYFGEDNGLFGGATAAFGGERWSGLVAVGHHQSQERENMGENRSTGASRTAPNPQEADGRSLLAKLVFATSEHQRFKLTVEGNEDDVDTDVLNAIGDTSTIPGTPASVRIASQTGDDRQTRARVAFSHEVDALDATFADSLQWQLYRQDSETTQRTREERATLRGGVAINPVLRERKFNFDQRLTGFDAVLHKDLAGGSVEHAITYGVELTRTQFRQKRDGRAANLLTGAVTNVISPDVFPVRDFPVSDTTQAAVFVQDEMSFAGGAFRLIPAVRVDYYKLEPKPDSIFAEDNPGVEVAKLSETSVSPKLGAVWHFNEDWSLFGGYQHGFRAPPYSDVNLGFTNLQFGYTAIPNPDLKPEKSNGVEFGLRFSNEAVYAEVSAYYNRYDDFIESSVQVSAPPQTPLIVFQSQNIEDAQIHGVEARGGVDLGAYSDTLAGWSIRGAASWSKGEDRTTNDPLPSIDPLRATIGIAYDADAWGIELAGRFAGRKDDLPAGNLFEVPGYGVADLLAHWNFAPGAVFDVGVFNLADRTYWDATDVPAGTLASSTVLDRYTSAGRNIGVSLSVSW